ncbi:MAG: glycerol dehydratase [Hyphomicrobiales bacterium]|nr:glycerol dehydratase [Hyphomicrobiales bacterium]
MSRERLSTADYPLAEKRPELIKGPRGIGLDDVTLDAVLADEVKLEDLRITPRALRLQAELARDANRATLGANFDRSAELVDIPQDFIMHVYELLRPGRAKSSEPLLEAARTLRQTYKAERMATFVEEAAEVYERRGLFKRRF